LRAIIPKPLYQIPNVREGLIEALFPPVYGHETMRIEAKTSAQETNRLIQPNETQSYIDSR